MKFALATLAAITVAAMADADPRPMTIDDLFQFKRVADPQISPDGKHVVYQVGTVDFDANKTSTALYLAATDGKTPPRQLTTPLGKKDTHPRFSPDGESVLFESNRAGTPQLFVIDLAGGEARQLTRIKSGAGNGVWSPDGKAIAFVSTIYPEFSKLPFDESQAKNADRDEAKEKSPVKVKVFTRLFYRHWDHYTEQKRHHLFVCDSQGNNPRDVTPGDRDAYPNSSTFSVGDDFTFTPDSKYLVFAAAPAEHEAWSTNYDLCRVAIDNTSDKWETLTDDNKAADNGPAFSPDGKKLAYRAQKKPGYEADKWDILVVPVKPDGSFSYDAKNVTATKDVSANGFGLGRQRPHRLHRRRQRLRPRLHRQPARRRGRRHRVRPVQAQRQPRPGRSRRDLLAVNRRGREHRQLFTRATVGPAASHGSGHASRRDPDQNLE